MADKKISALGAASTPLTGTEVLPIVQAGSTVKVAISDVTAGRAVSMSTLGVGTNSVFGIASFQNSTVRWETGELSGVNYIESLNNARTATSEFRLYNNNFKVFTGASGAYGERFGISTAGDATLNTGNLIQGTAAKGINFTANTPAAGMTSQLLNWYEEGTWTATDASGAGLTFVGAAGRYTRIGRSVFIEVSFQFPATVNAANVKIGGLPFTANTYSFISAASNSGVNITPLTDAGAATFTSYTSGTLTPNTNNQFSGTQFYVSGTYSI